LNQKNGLTAEIRVHIYFEFHDDSWGGGNQFLKALKNECIKQDYYENDPIQAQVILFNSHHNMNNVIKLKKKYPEKFFVHRIDGPMAYRGKSGVKLDRHIFSINSFIADGTVFQSEWSRQENYNNGMKKNNFEAVIHNAPDPKIFFPTDRVKIFDGKRKIKLIAVSWSNNQDKGFDIYHYLDENLDFDRYEMTFVGQIDKPFNNINVIKPLPSSELAKQLRQHDIFIFASKIEACSNSLLEALHCGLPAVARNSSSNPEILFKGGEVYNKYADIDLVIGPLFGRQDYLYNIHYNVFDFKKITQILMDAGFCGISRYDWRDTEHTDVDDYSSAYIPHMDKENGIHISLNVECRKPA